MRVEEESLRSGPPPTITIENLSGEVQDGEGRRRLFESVTFRLQPRRLLAITGRNGAGKTSILRLLAGSETAVQFMGSARTAEDLIPIDRLHTLYRPWFAETGHEIFPTLTVRENLEVVLLANRQLWDSKVQQLLGDWKVTGFLDRPASQLSGGEMRRVQILMAILSRANAIFLDEPFTGLDDTGIAIFNDLIREVLDQEVIVVLTEHHIEFLKDIDIARLELSEPTEGWPEARRENK